MYDQLNKRRQKSAYAFFKKILISLSLILLLLNANVSHFNKAKAAADIPGYADEMFETVMVGIMTAAGAAAHAGNYIEENLATIIDTAGLTYDQLAPEMKQAFNDSMSAAGDRIVIAGDLITSFLDNAQNFLSDSRPLPTGTFTYDSGSVRMNGDYKIIYTSPNGIPSNPTNLMTVSTSFTNYYGTLTVGVTSERFSGEMREQLINLWNAFEANPEIANLQALAAFLGGSVSVTLDGVDIGTGVSDPIYDQVDRWLRDRAEAGGLSLGLPQSVPYTNSGLKLGVNEQLGGLTLDGTNLYTGDIVWRDVLPNVAEGALTLPAPYIYNPTGLPLTLVDGIPVAPDGTIVNPADVTVSANPITHVREGDTTTTITNTYTGSTVNTVTNEWVTYNTYVYEAATGTVTTKPETPPKKPEKKPSSNDGTPNALLLALLLAMLDLIRAIIWYLIRLFQFVLQLPQTPSIPIPNPVFQWFISTKFLGINVYQAAIYLSTFALSFGVFKVIRRYFND